MRATKEEIATDVAAAEARVARGAAVMKMVCGCANNCARLVMSHAIERMEGHPAYRHAVKRAWRQALDEWTRYETRLLHSSGPRFFHVADMSPEVRKKYGADLTDRDYYDFWCGMAGAAYKQTWPLVTCLAHKYGRSMRAHGTAHADRLQWAVTAGVCLDVAHTLWRVTADEVARGMGLPAPLLHRAFKPLDVEPVARAWQRAIEVTEPDTYELDEAEQRNIRLSLQQLYDAWADAGMMYDAAAEAIEGFDDIFRTKGEMKKALREVAEAKAEL